MDPIKMKRKEWVKFLYPLDTHLHHGRDTDFVNFSALTKAIGLITNGAITMDEQIAITALIINVATDHWAHLANIGSGKMENILCTRHGFTHPFLALSELKYRHGVAQPELLTITQKLWTEAPNGSRENVAGLSALFRGLREDFPENAEWIAALMKTNPQPYLFIGIETILMKGAIDLASTLFRANLEHYQKGYDPMIFDGLVKAGLPVEDAVQWLNQSTSAGIGYESHYKNALERWPQIAPQ